MKTLIKLAIVLLAACNDEMTRTCKQECAVAVPVTRRVMDDMGSHEVRVFVCREWGAPKCDK